jgi:hypothetical protein
MLHAITRGALRLDLWLQAKLGRPYHALLGVGLAIEIGRRLIEIPEHLASVHRLAGLALILLMEAALLVHQIGALSHHIGGARLGRGEAHAHPDADGASALGSGPTSRGQRRTGGPGHGRHQPPDHPG